MNVTDTQAAATAKMIGDFIDAGLARFGSVEAFTAALRAANAERAGR
jgi:hypothetical protein